MGIAIDTAATKEYNIGKDVFKEFVYNVTSDGSGAVAATNIGDITGYIINFEVILDETDTPSNSFSVYLYNSSSTLKYDILGGEGASLANTADHRRKTLVGSAYSEEPYNGNPYFVAAGMGASKKLVFKLLVKRV